MEQESYWNILVVTVVDDFSQNVDLTIYKAIPREN